MKKLAFSLLAFSCLGYSWGEVEEIVLRWQSGICQQQCRQYVVERLEKVEQVTEIRVEGDSATLRWRPNSRFSYTPIDRAMRLVGINIDRISLTVRGTVKSTPRGIYLQSIGDGTEFLLIGPLNIEPGKAPARGNIKSHRLSEAREKQLLEAEREHRTLTVRGPLFQPERRPALNLIIESLN